MSAPVAAATKVSKPKATKKPASHPTYSAMIRKAVSELKEKSGSSKSAILKFILSHYKLGENVVKINSQLRLALKRSVAKGELVQVKGTGASGSFKLGEKKAAAPAAKKSVAKKSAGAKVPKSPKKAKAAKEPKAEKKAKTPKKAKAPKAKTAKKPSAKTTKPKATKPKVSKPKTAKKVKA
ncbi:hypothetical protein V3C99_014239 [Haemonchus contortus]